MSNILSVVIPTYNRKKRLLNVLNILKKQTNQNFLVIISDNNSNYDVEKTILENFSNSFCEKIKVHKNIVNKGVAINLAEILSLSSSEWIWTLSDDDEPFNNSVEIIYDEIEKVRDENIGMLSFSAELPVTHMGRKIKNNKTFISFSELIDESYNIVCKEKVLEMIYLSTGVHNIKLLKDYLFLAYEYSYVHFAHVVPAIFALNDKKIKIRTSSQKIVKYLPPNGDGWNIAKVMLGLSTTSHLPLNLTKEYFGKLMELVIWIDPIRVFYHCLSDSEEEKRKYYLIYDNNFKYSYSFKRKILSFCYLILMKCSLSYFVLLLLKKIRIKMKR